MKTRLVQDQRGFTLPEMLVTMLVMLVVLFALHSIFDASIRVFSFGNDKVEAVENARVGLERMEREVRSAYPVTGPSATPRYRFFNANGAVSSPPAQFPSTTQITLGNELGAWGDGTIRCPVGGTCEYITYKLAGTPPSGGGTPPACSASTAPCTLRRVNAASSSGAGDPVVEFVAPGGLTFAYLLADGTTTATTDNGTAATDVAVVRIQLRIQADEGTQTLTTDVDLRN